MTPLPGGAVKLKVLAYCLAPKSFMEIHRDEEIPQSSLSKFLGELEHDGLVKKGADGRYLITEDGIKALRIVEQNNATSSLINVKGVNQAILDDLLATLFGLILVLRDEGRNLGLFADARLSFYIPPQAASKKGPSGWVDLGQPTVSISHTNKTTGGKGRYDLSLPASEASASTWYQTYGECWDAISDLASFCEHLLNSKIVKFSKDPIEKASKLFERTAVRSQLVPLVTSPKEYRVTLAKPSTYKDYSQTLDFAVPMLVDTVKELKGKTTGLENLIVYFESRIHRLSLSLAKLHEK